ncbi:uncharacterized protein [Glycine max]|uniref:uncharacterized protein isoform X1 n=1 Tax=Glycine max TaxID=3847 RepID=UPI001B357CA2|nr:uncharacterized protein LOC100305791 isoform X1 [Glycine max]
MLMSKQKKSQIQNAKRLLISINVLGSAGPIRFVVNEEELVAAVIDTALKSYAREGRLPVLGNNTTGFALYCPHLGSDGYQRTTPKTHKARELYLSFVFLGRFKTLTSVLDLFVLNFGAFDLMVLQL